jgi:gluconate kinase
MAARHGHFMPAALLDSQFSILEEPSPNENPIAVDIGGQPEKIVGEIAERLRVAPTP